MLARSYYTQSQARQIVFLCKNSPRYTNRHTYVCQSVYLPTYLPKPTQKSYLRFYLKKYYVLLTSCYWIQQFSRISLAPGYLQGVKKKNCTEPCALFLLHGHIPMACSTWSKNGIPNSCSLPSLREFRSNFLLSLNTIMEIQFNLFWLSFVWLCFCGFSQNI